MNTLETIRHSCAHLLASAVHELFPEAQFWTWPAINDGFYYDMLLPRTLIPEDLEIIEKKMKHLAKQSLIFERSTQPIDEAITYLRTINQPFKAEIAADFKKQGETEVTFYKNWHFVDLCAGPHVKSTKNTGAFKLTNISWAYFRGDESRPMLQRVYWVAFETEEELSNYFKMLEEAKKRDHRVIWEKMQLFTFDEEVWPWLPLWLPNWAILVEELEALAKEKEEEYWYLRVRSPHITKWKLYVRSWHLPYYSDSMFPPMQLDGEEYYLKPMNCPHHHKIFAAHPKSYRDLPIRYAEYGHCYRYEDSWALFGLMRVRSLCMNDAHIYCSEEQFEEEFSKVIELYLFYFRLFGVEKFQMRLSKHSKEWLWKKYVDNEALWIKTEDLVRQCLINLNVPFVEAENEAAFYWPKIDVQIWSVIWREFTLATNQLDFAVPEKFDLKYKAKDWTDKIPICIHRAPLSTHERLIWFLIEHFAWVFPLWLAPKQVLIISVNEKFNSYAKFVLSELTNKWVRCEFDSSENTLGKKIRNAESLHINYVIVIWEKEEQWKSVSVRNYKTKEQKEFSLNDFIKEIEKEIVEKRL